MMADRFYVSCPLAVGVVKLEGAEAHHLAAVCRFRPGDQICLFNGDGHEYPAMIETAGRRDVLVRVSRVDSPNRELPIRLVIAAPLPKGDRTQFLLEKLTEIGVASFVPLETSLSVIKPTESRMGKLRRYVIESSKQCGRNILLEVEPPGDWKSFCGRADLPQHRAVAHPRGKATWPRSAVDMALAVGPEGGFTEQEINLASAAGWQIVDLGPRILRIETAALVLAVVATKLI
jgi:16S rRNA (uracil1498-N3)-methyltransferase